MISNCTQELIDIERESQEIIKNELAHYPPSYQELLSVLSLTKLPYSGFTDYYLHWTRNDYTMTTSAKLDDLLVLAANDLCWDLKKHRNVKWYFKIP